MTDKLICPDDGLECIYPERKEEGCWGCSKIQDVLAKMKEVEVSGRQEGS